MNYIIIGSDNGFSPVSYQDVIWANDSLSSIGPLEQILVKIFF